MKLVILHGWGQNTKVWRDFARMLGENAISFNMPGFGGEKKIDDNWGVPEYANWVVNKINNKKPIVLIGHSFGGRVAAEIASKKPTWLKALILSGAPCIYRPALKAKVKILMAKMIKHFIPASLRSHYFPKDLKKSADLGLEKVFRKVIRYDQTKQIQKISAPTLLIWGERDNDVPLKIAREINSLIKDSELKIISQANHNSFLDNPHLFYGYVKSFINNLSNK